MEILDSIVQSQIDALSIIWDLTFSSFYDPLYFSWSNIALKPTFMFSCFIQLCDILQRKWLITSEVSKVSDNLTSFRWKYWLHRYPIRSAVIFWWLIWIGNYTVNVMGVPLQWISPGEIGMEGRGRGPGAPGLRGLLEQVNLRGILEHLNPTKEKLLGFVKLCKYCVIYCIN